MGNIEFTPLEQKYLNCDIPMVDTGSAVLRIISGVLASALQAAFLPSVDKADQGLMRTIREIRYTKYKKAILRKQNGTLREKDKKTLKKLNSKEFILEPDTYDADDFTQKIYEEYMRTHGDGSQEQ